MKRFYLLLLLALSFSGNTFPAHSFVSKQWLWEEQKAPVKIEVADNMLIVENLPKNAVIAIYSIVGVKVLTINVTDGSGQYALNLPKGYYILKTGEIVKKIALK